MAVPTTAIYFTCYDQLCEALKNRPGKHDEHIPVIAGSLSRCKLSKRENWNIIPLCSLLEFVLLTFI